MNATGFAVLVARRWLRIYTAGLPPPIASTRRREIESDLWEQAAESDTAAAALSIIARTLLGAPHDLGWRFTPMTSSRLRVAVVQHCAPDGCQVQTPEGQQITVGYSALVHSRIRVRPGELVAITYRDDAAAEVGHGSHDADLEVVWRMFRGRITALGRRSITVQRIDSSGAGMARGEEIPLDRALGGAGGYAPGDRVFFGDDGSGETHLLARADSDVTALQQKLATRLPVMEAALRLFASEAE